ncbi:MAG: NupC/NupG family nucleoside CNT transporter [Ignavibacteria bacterium]|nr:NupC/NupG family nucleoside CNT transporter [Ignavibacteria bacterium]
MFWTKILSFFGLLFVFLLVWLISENKRKFPVRVVFWGLILQFGFALLVLYVPFGVESFRWLGDRVAEFLDFSKKGAEFVFGNLGKIEHQNLFGYQFAVIISATIIFFSSVVAVLYRYGIIQRIVYAMAWVMSKTMGTSGVESLSAASNVFLGQTEAPLLVRHYLPNATRSELFSIMCGGFATIAGGVMAAYIQMGISPVILITASLISAPGSLMLSKIVIEPKSSVKSIKEVKHITIPETKNILDAITQGASDGMRLAINVVAMLIAFVSLIALIDAGLNLVHTWLAEVGIYFPKSLKEIFGYVFLPFAFLVGIPAEEAKIFASLLGTKISINEFIAYANLAEMIKNGALSQRTITLATFALCGFANFGSIAIQIGGIGALVPERRHEVALLGFKAMIVGALANLLTATIAGLIL